MVADGTHAAVDIGTNTMRLLVADAEGAPLARALEVVRLGQDVDAGGVLVEAAMARAEAAFERFAATWRRHSVLDSDVVVGATSAVRDAGNRAAFLDRLREIAPAVTVRILSGDEEAEGAFRGAVGGLPDLPRPIAVLDIGGGSTELVVGDVDDRVVAAVSMQLGSVRLTERHLPSDPPTEAEVLGAIAEVRSQLDRATDQLGAPLRDVATLVGVAGTVTTVAALHGRLGPWEDGRVHGARLSAGDVLQVSNDLVVADRASIAEHDEVQPGREDVIAAGALILRGVVDALRVDGLVVSEADGLDGLLAAWAAS